MNEQYLKSIDIFDSENTRFWARFNLFTGFQFVLFAGFASGFDKVKESPEIGMLIIFAGLSSGIFNFLVVRRSLMTMLAISKVIDHFESENEDLVLLKKYKEYSGNEIGGILRLCLMISVTLVALWVFLFISFINIM